MKNSIRQHYPNFCEGFDVSIVDFDTVEELLAIPFVAKFKTYGFGHPGEPKFDRFSKSHNHLMVEYKEPREWWVVGYLKHPELVDLPTCVCKK